MYQDPLVLYREYVQNAVDSIDLAIKQGVLDVQKARVVINVDIKKCRIIIEDNGIGVPAEQVESTLLDIGNSKKSYKSARGFRGIGRLVGLSNARRLVFETSYPGEDCCTRLTFNSDRLQELLTPGEYMNLDLEDVLMESVQHDTFPEEATAHYFRVILESVSNKDEALQVEMVRDYIAQSCPLPYDAEIFTWGDMIKSELAEKGQQLAEYQVILLTEDEEYVLYKPYRDSYLADKQKKLMDSLEHVEIYPLISTKGQILGIAWLGKSKLLGSILNDSIKGIRFRKGNILVGDKLSLNGIFKEERFNGWFQGEVFVFHENIIPNARRDSFERTPEFAELMSSLEVLGDELSRRIRAASVARAKVPLRRVITKAGDGEQSELSLVDNSVSIAHALKTLDILRQSKVSALPFLNANQNLTATEKKLLERLYEFLCSELDAAYAMQLLVKFLDQQEPDDK